MVGWKALVGVVLLGVVACGFGSAPGGSVRKIRLPDRPADLPLPEAATLRTARDLGARGLNLVFETQEALPAAAGRMRSRMEAAGWVLLSDIVLEQAQFASYRKGERAAALGVSRSGDQVLISIAYTARPGAEWEGDEG